MEEDYSLDTYNANIELFAEDNPLEACLLEQADCSGMEFCRSEDGSLNIIDHSSGKPFYLHAPEGGRLEADLWSKIPPLGTTDSLFVYGLGLGYYYFPLKQWLEEDSKRHLIFLEDDPRVIRMFLATAWAKELLVHPKVHIRQIPKIAPDDEGWRKLRTSMRTLIAVFAEPRAHVSSLQSYFFQRFDFFSVFAIQWLTNLGQAWRGLSEYLYDPYERFKSYYANLPYAPKAAMGEKLRGAMKGIPAIMCGAGPSLQKQLPLLAQQADHAFLLASGSAMNPLTRNAILPHAGGGLDSTPGQLSRLMARWDCGVPVFYNDFFYHPAFMEWVGPKICLEKQSGVAISAWFNQQLGIDEDARMISGVSTSNYLLEAAAFLGCDPIIMTGMDLSFANEQRYAHGVQPHPTDDSRMRAGIIRKNEFKIQVPGDGGQPVFTTRHWHFEAVCIAAFRLRHPELKVFNSTEGGMRIEYVDALPLKESVERYLGEQWDIEGWFHGQYVNAMVTRTVDEKDVLAALSRWEASLRRCNEKLIALIHCLVENMGREETHSPPKYGLYSGIASLWQIELHAEPAYRYFLGQQDRVFDIMHAVENRVRKAKLAPLDIKRMKYLFEEERCRTLMSYANKHLKYILQSLEEYRNWNKEASLAIKDQETIVHVLEKLQHGVLYETSEGRMRIEDPVLGISLAVPFAPQTIPNDRWPKGGESPSIEALVGMKEDKREGQTLYFYPDGTVKAEAYYHEGRLHGPWTYFGLQGQILARSWYVEGVKQGAVLLYDSEGSVYSYRGYRDGVREGRHLHFYPDGKAMSDENYSLGLLEGTAFQYHPNGRIKREAHFMRGVLDGFERFYDIHGTLIAETCYEGGEAVGTSRRWHSNGMLAREVVHHVSSDDISEWDETGKEA